MVFIYILQLEQGKYYIGKTNNPQYLKLIAQKLADLFEVQVDEIIKITTENALKFKAFSNFQ